MYVRVVAVAFLVCSGLAWAHPSPAAAAEVVVRIGDRLDPPDVTVAPGTVVRWVNEDGDRHRVRSTGGATEFDSGNLEPGDSFTVTFSSAGRTTYLDDRDRADTAYHGAVTVSGGGGGGAAPPPPGDPAQPGPAPSAPPSSATIAIANRAFSPASIVIAPGGTITWTNRDDRDHTGTGQGGAFDTGNLTPGATATTTHPSEGTFSFLCELHPDMTGVVRVSSASGATPAPAPPPTAAPNPPGAAPPPEPAPSAAPRPAGSATAGPSTRTVQIGDLFFSPATLDLRVGDTVVWTNAGRAPHTATGASFDSGRLATGGTFRWTAPAAGTVAYGCTLHPEMTGQLRVLAASDAAPPLAASAASSPETPAADPEAAPPPPGPASLEPADADLDAPTKADVEVQDFAFAPASVRIAAGGTVTWRFTGAAPHTATGDDFDSGIVEAGATFEHTFDDAGTFAYSCTVHPDMTASVEVIETDLISSTKSAPTPSGGSSDRTQAWTVALLGGAGILAGSGALLVGARRFLLAS